MYPNFLLSVFFFTSNRLSLGGREIFSLSHLKLNSRRILKWSRIETRVYLFMSPAFRSSHTISISPFSLSFKWKTMSGKHNSQYFCYSIANFSYQYTPCETLMSKGRRLSIFTGAESTPSSVHVYISQFNLYSIRVKANLQ